MVKLEGTRSVENRIDAKTMRMPVHGLMEGNWGRNAAHSSEGIHQWFLKHAENYEIIAPQRRGR
jgi:isopropylmalate/homocitrate/citramalate synthase